MINVFILQFSSQQLPWTPPSIGGDWRLQFLSLRSSTTAHQSWWWWAHCSI